VPNIFPCRDWVNILPGPFSYDLESHAFKLRCDQSHVHYANSNMHSLSLLILTALLPSLAFSEPKCSATHLIVARGSFEPQGEGISSAFSTEAKQFIGADSEALVYPARIPYRGSISVGVENLKKAIARYTAACPSSQIVLVGYSQGGAVTVDALCGGGEDPEIGPKTPGMTLEEAKNVKAAVVLGDPRFVPGISYNAGTNHRTGGVSDSQALRYRSK
jgi:acetylxylan esterase